MSNIVAGLDLDTLQHSEMEVSYPAMVPGRRVHIDADFGCYHASYEKEGEPERSFEDMCHSFEVMNIHLGRLAGAEHTTLHLTPHGSDKGGRFWQATTKEYQGNRDKEKSPRLLQQVRAWAVDGSPFHAIGHMSQEADDGMAIEAWKANAGQYKNLCVVCSADKDLKMVPGLLLNPMTKEMTELAADDTFGWIAMDKTGSTAKLIGRGTQFFWAQMLMGDGADNIPGLHKLSGLHVNQYHPSVAVKKATAMLDKMEEGEIELTAKQYAMHCATQDKQKAKSIGPGLTYDVIVGMKTDSRCFESVKSMYAAQPEQLTHWETAEDVSWQEAFLSNARLLWMRREQDDPDEVIKWFAEIGK